MGVLRGQSKGATISAAVAWARPQRRTPPPLAPRGLFRKDMPAVVTLLQRAPLSPSLKASREKCPSPPTSAVAQARPRQASLRRSAESHDRYPRLASVFVPSGTVHAAVPWPSVPDCRPSKSQERAAQ